MSQSLSISQYVHDRFQEAFGPPHNTLGRDYHWKFQSSPDAPPINVLLNGTLDIPLLWVFDAHYHKDGASGSSITHRDQVDDIIKQIQDLVRRAGRPSEVKP